MNEMPIKSDCSRTFCHCSWSSLFATKVQLKQFVITAEAVLLLQPKCFVCSITHCRITNAEIHDHLRKSFSPKQNS